MAKQELYTPSRVPGAWSNFWVPFLLGAFLCFVDAYLIPGIFALPLLFLMALIFLAFRLPAWMVAIWAFMYAGVIFVILVLPLKEGTTDPALKPYVRTAIFLAGGSAAILLARQRQRLEKGHEALFGVISALPLPVIVSDISGDILLLNGAAQALLKSQLGELSGLSYFSTFVGPEHQGQAIATYIGYFDAGQTGPLPVVLRTRGETPLTLHSLVSVVRIGRAQYALTIVEKMD